MPKIDQFTSSDASILNIKEVETLYVEEVETPYLQEAEALLRAFQNNVSIAISAFNQYHPDFSDSNFSPDLNDARLVLARQRLSVKRLKYHPKFIVNSTLLNEIKLADTQLIIARENGLNSWPKLKNHIQAMKQAENALSQKGNRLDNEFKTLHIRCGDDIKSALPKCGLQDDFAQIINPFPQGPVPPSDPLDDFVLTRANFVKTTYNGLVPEDKLQNSNQDFYLEEKILREVPGHYKRLVLWFEHDAFDQLCFAYILHHLVNNKDLSGVKIELIEVSQFPGVERFIGIGQLSRQPETLRLLWQQRITISSKMMAFGARIWNAYTANNPNELWQLSQIKKAPLPLMQTAMKRILQELLSVKNGLGLSEYLALVIVDREGPLTPGKIFHYLISEIELQPYLGDIMFLALLKNLFLSTQPALSVIKSDPIKSVMAQQTLKMTEVGKQLLHNKINWLKINSMTRWVGGIEVKGMSEQKNWYWDDKNQKPINLD